MHFTGRDKSTAPGTAVTEVGALGVLCPHRKSGLTEDWGSQHRQIELRHFYQEEHTQSHIVSSHMSLMSESHI